jgi:nuclear pore complex protein Nup210
LFLISFSSIPRSASRLDIIQLTLVDVQADYQCSSKAVVTVISKEAQRNTAIVLAEEIHSSQVLRADVILDLISSLKIVTTTRELYMEEPPELFEIRAYDDQGSV